MKSEPLVGEQLLRPLVHNYLRRGAAALPSIWENQLVLGLQNNLIWKVPDCAGVLFLYSNIQEKGWEKHPVSGSEEDGRSGDRNSPWDLHPPECQLAQRIWELFCIVGFDIRNTVLWSILTAVCNLALCFSTLWHLVNAHDWSFWYFITYSMGSCLS